MHHPPSTALASLAVAAATFAPSAPSAFGQRGFAPIAEPRSIDGSGNHPDDLTRGAAGTPMIRSTPVDYGDGVGSPAGLERASARHVSNGACAQSLDRPEPTGLSDLFWQWGQFLDHDLTETPIHAPFEAFPIAVPSGDPWFDPLGTGVEEIPFARSAPVRVEGRREQINLITAWIDGSQIYGSDAERAHALRAHDGTGRLATSAGELLPFNTAGLPNAPSSDPAFFLAGDVRANEQIGLTALHVLFVREHNHWVDRIRDDRHGSGHALTADEVYELARAIVSAELQLITYREWLPLLLGDGVVGPDSTYRPELDGTIRNEFATAAFRLGHSMLSPRLLRLDASGAAIRAGHVSLADAFFSPDLVLDTGIDPILRGLLTQRAQAFDVYVVDGVRNFLFGPPGAGGFDLASLNLQRGRDHGLGSYGEVRQALGLGALQTLHDVTSNDEVLARLRSVARSPATLDLWVGGLAEDRVPGALVGPTFHALLVEQFEALRDGDRLWYSRQLSPGLARMVERQSLSRVIRRNSGVGGERAESPFLAPAP